MDHTADVYLQNPAGYQVDLDALRAFERGLDPRQPEQSRIPARVLGYGEISTVFEIDADGLRGLAFKRLPIFYTQAELAAYRVAFDEYNRLLTGEIDICMPPHGYAFFPGDAGRPIFYIIQGKEPSASIGHRAIHLLPREEIPVLLERLLKELRKVWDYNRGQDRLQVAIDGQISNWAIANFDLEHPTLADDVSFVYTDTSTPLFRIRGEEQLDPELFLRSAPSFLRWVLRLLFLEDVLNRYYDFHLVVVDVIANFYKEQRPELIPGLVSAANDFFSGAGADLNVAPFNEKEIRDYYREDALIWSLYLSMRRVDRFLHTRILQRDYPYILPGKVKR